MKLSENVHCMCAISLSTTLSLSHSSPLFTSLSFSVCVVHCSWLPAQRRQWQHKEVRKEAKHLLTSVQVCVSVCVSVLMSWQTGQPMLVCVSVCECVCICALSNGTSAWRLAAFRRQLWGALFLRTSATTATHISTLTHTHTYTKKKSKRGRSSRSSWSSRNGNGSKWKLAKFRMLHMRLKGISRMSSQYGTHKVQKKRQKQAHKEHEEAGKENKQIIK